MNAHDVARYFLTLPEEDAGDAVSNMKLQKLLYYSQGFHLALFGGPLFDEPIEAWTHGPVVPAVYRTYKECKASRIPKPSDFDPDVVDPPVRELLDEVWQVFGQFSAGKLRNMSHQEPPWRNVQNGETISHAAMKEYFLTQVNDG